MWSYFNHQFIYQIKIMGCGPFLFKNGKLDFLVFSDRHYTYFYK